MSRRRLDRRGRRAARRTLERLRARAGRLRAGLACVLPALVRAPAFNSLPEHPALVATAEKLLGDSVLVHQRKIARIGFPQNEGHQTPAHQDFFHIRGAEETYTAWAPLGDCPQQLGCLAVADGSHKAGFREHAPSSGPGGWGIEAASEDRRGSLGELALEPDDVVGVRDHEHGLGGQRRGEPLADLARAAALRRA